MGQFLETWDHTYRNFPLKFLGTLHMEVTSGPWCQERCISFYLNGEFYEVNLSAFNSIFDIQPSTNLTYWHVPRECNPNAL